MFALILFCFVFKKTPQNSLLKLENCYVNLLHCDELNILACGQNKAFQDIIVGLWRPRSTFFFSNFFVRFSNCEFTHVYQFFIQLYTIKINLKIIPKLTIPDERQLYIKKWQLVVNSIGLTCSPPVLFVFYSLTYIHFLGFSLSLHSLCLSPALSLPQLVSGLA